ncbi:hypothetical protein GCK72_006951 [Caenorhabditis remanei]|uniref:C-type lectin domain-containing protein n=1 Tax=Caenorhabditis remanei TaxID=31234 RepID=A0A6A5HKT2_CAERE|nr:hypothetical protein GCK72_006951 [Caenorhabditis remanei]KAF1766993.1 hypothetical protein GCK72_006951 [Caenorhabditis remanei]
MSSFWSLLILLNFLVIAVSSGKTNGHCQKGWTKFTRPSGDWCIKIFYETLVTQPEAEAKCQAADATLSSFQNQVESLWVAATSVAHIYPNTGSIWIGAKRTKACLKSQLTEKCTRFNSFEWTDKSANGTDGFLWDAREPSNTRFIQNCLIMTIGSTGYVSGYDIQVGTLNDNKCDLKLNSKDPQQIQGFVCGKPPGC